MSSNQLTKSAAELDRVEALRTDARNRFLDLLDSVQGVQKGLVIDPSLSGPLSQLVEFTTIKTHGVSKIYLLQEPLIDTECSNLLFLTRPTLLNMRFIAAQIAKSRASVHFALFFVSNRSIVCEQFLEEQGVLGDLVIAEWSLGFLPLERDLLSLELNNSFSELFVVRFVQKHDITSLQNCALGLFEVQQQLGRFPQIRAKGRHAKSLVEVVDRLRRRRQDVGQAPAQAPPYFSMLIVIDRTVDLLSPLHTQLTYSGLLDEFYGIKNGYIDVDATLVSQKQTGQKTRKVKLSGEDLLYAELRDLNFAAVGTTLNRIARAIQSDYNERHQAQTVSQIRDFVSKLGTLQHEHQSLRIHTNLAEELWNSMDPLFHMALEVQQNLLSLVDLDKQNESIEDLVLRGATMETVLRLLCVESIVYGGLKPKTFDSFRQLIIEAYGYEHLATLHGLEQLGLLTRAVGKSNFVAMRSAMSLIIENVNEQQPNDIAYVYSGYAPLSVRVVQTLADPQWKQWDDLNKLVTAPHADQTFTRVERGKHVAVLYLGGVTYAEVSAFRYLNVAQKDRDGDNAMQYMVLTTQMLNGQDVVSVRA
ncbi:Vacuolar protein-sorting-associated protein 33 [Sorochytrium milnesiophthora]